MRRTLTNLAAVKPSRFLEAGAPTGLAGLHNHPTPRKALLYLYNSTLEKLQQIPESSLYRQSTEALVRHRLNIVKGIEPEGYAAWKEKADKIIAEHPDVFNTPEGETHYKGGKYLKEVKNGEVFVTIKGEGFRDENTEEWDGATDTSAELEGTRTTRERAKQVELTRPMANDFMKDVKFEAEPPLTVQQIEEIEQKIGAGLIEEVIQVAEGEEQLVDVMIRDRVWEDLEEKPIEGQWDYFRRDTGTPTTQAPPQ